MQIEMGERLTIDLLEESQELVCPMAWHTFADDRACGAWPSYASLRDRAAGQRARPWRHGGIFRRDEAAWRMCRHKVEPAPRLFRVRYRWRRRDRRFRSAGRLTCVVAIHA
jgi:hypothetical protein